VPKKQNELLSGLDKFKKHIEKCQRLVEEIKRLTWEIQVQAVRRRKLMKKVPKEGFSQPVKPPGRARGSYKH
jgi:hypothetical protein